MIGKSKPSTANSENRGCRERGTAMIAAGAVTARHVVGDPNGIERPVGGLMGVAIGKTPVLRCCRPSVPFAVALKGCLFGGTGDLGELSQV